MAGARAPRPATARLVAFAAIAAVLAGCAPETKDPRPASKPDQLGVAVVHKGQSAVKLTRGRVSTKSGDILILEPDGTVTEVALDSASGRDAFNVSEDELAALSINLGIDLSAAPLGGNFNIAPRQVRRGPTAQQKALEAFAARTQPALPRFPEGFQVDPEIFLGTQVKTVHGDPRGSLVEVVANLRPGVDADVAMAYATCALAGWAKDEGQDYARHIRTLQDKRRGMLLVGAVFTLSDSKPMGLRVMETSDTLRECKDRGFPAA